MTHLGTQTLETERIILRRFTLDDAEAVFNNWTNDSEVTKYLMWPTHKAVKDSEAVLNLWVSGYEEPSSYQWAIELKETGEVIGSIGVVKRDDSIKMAHIGYCIGKKWWNKGYTSEALSAVIHFLFTQVGMNRVESRHDPNNPNSGKVMQKCGMKYEGTCGQADKNNQGICDYSMYAILAEDYSAQQ